MTGQLLGTALILAVAVATDLRESSSASLRNNALGNGASTSHSGKASKILASQEVDQHLVVCNAYASKHTLEIFHVQTTDRLTGSTPLSYKECRDFTMPLAEGDQLDFKAGSTDVGTFYATGMPKTSASLLLIPHRRDSNSIAMSFESHAFADLQSPQIAVVDAYRGSGKAEVKIMDAVTDSSSAPAEETLKFSSVVAVNPGNYKVALFQNNATSADTASHKPLLVESQEKYVVMRVGIDASKGKEAYPQELVVFPSGSLRLGLSLCSLALWALAMAMTNF
jgi:hypothetical protein